MKDYKKIVIIAVTGISILVAGDSLQTAVFSDDTAVHFPFVMAFQSEANRLGALVGAINSLIYTIAYIYMGVYASAASSVLFSFPIQLMTFFSWRKKAYKKTVVFRRMSNKVRMIVASAILLMWAVIAGIFFYLDYEYAVLDSVTFLFGFIIPIMTMLAYIEYTYLWIVQAIIGVFLNIQMVVVDYRQTTYLIYGIYVLYCVILAFINVQKFYKEQQTIVKEREQGS